jgi:hypothetical protein
MVMAIDSNVAIAADGARRRCLARVTGVFDGRSRQTRICD